MEMFLRKSFSTTKSGIGNIIPLNLFISSLTGFFPKIHIVCLRSKMHIIMLLGQMMPDFIFFLSFFLDLIFLHWHDPLCEKLSANQLL